MNKGIRINQLEERCGESLQPDQRETINHFIEEGFLERDGEILKTTQKGQLVLDELSVQLRDMADDDNALADKSVGGDGVRVTTTLEAKSAAHDGNNGSSRAKIIKHQIFCLWRQSIIHESD